MIREAVATQDSKLAKQTHTITHVYWQLIQTQNTKDDLALLNLFSAHKRKRERERKEGLTEKRGVGEGGGGGGGGREREKEREREDRKGKEMDLISSSHSKYKSVKGLTDIQAVHARCAGQLRSAAFGTEVPCSTLITLQDVSGTCRFCSTYAVPPWITAISRHGQPIGATVPSAHSAIEPK